MHKYILSLVLVLIQRNKQTYIVYTHIYIYKYMLNQITRANLWHFKHLQNIVEQQEKCENIKLNEKHFVNI